MAQKKVTTIPATMRKHTVSPINCPEKRKVAGYARVSTNLEEQLTSYEAQVDYYTNYIKSHDNWEFAGMYTDIPRLKRIQCKNRLNTAHTERKYELAIQK